MNTIQSIILDRECAQVEQLSKVIRAIYEPAKPKADMPDTATIRQQIQELTSREAQLQAELNDVRERLTYLQDSNYTRFPKEVV